MREYQFWLLDNNDTEYEIWAVGLESITDEIEHCNLKPLEDQFPQVDRQLLRRPTGAVDILIGMDYRGYHPVEHSTKEHLRVTKSLLGTGFILTGAAPGTCKAQSSMSEAINFSQGSKTIPDQTVVYDVSQRVDTFWEAEALGCRKKQQKWGVK